MSDKLKETVQESGSETPNQEEITSLVEALSGSSRRERQNAAANLAALSKTNPEMLVSFAAEIADALNRPEAQTRWECLDVLTRLVDVESRACDKGVIGAETALFDEESGPVRLGAMKFLCKLGSTTETRSRKIWPLIDEGIQCYHGDFEFQDMLVAVIDFSSGKLAPEVKEGLRARMEFDAANAKGALKRRAQQIIDNLK